MPTLVELKKSTTIPSVEDKRFAAELDRLWGEAVEAANVFQIVKRIGPMLRELPDVGIPKVNELLTDMVRSDQKSAVYELHVFLDRWPGDPLADRIRDATDI